MARDGLKREFTTHQAAWRCLLLALRPEGANHQWRNPPGWLSIGPVADERLSQVTGGLEPRDKGHLGWLSDPAGRYACEA
jgi:hypothetical protein